MLRMTFKVVGYLEKLTTSSFAFQLTRLMSREQNNKLVKGSGGAVGLTENPKAFKRWMVAGPEQARLLIEFEDQFMPA